MQKLTIFKINNQIYVKYTPQHTTEPQPVPKEVINYKGTLYTPVDINNLPFPPQPEQTYEFPW